MRTTILFEAKVQKDIRRLDEAWAQSETFALIPDKTSGSTKEIQSAVSNLPEELRHGHFALLTSGSTGNPKLVIGEKRRAELLAHVLHQVQASSELSQTIVLLPLSYCFAFVNQWLWARTHHKQLVLTEGFARPDDLISALTSADNAMLCLVGAQVPLLFQFMQGIVFEGVSRLHFAGGTFPQNHLEALGHMFPNAQVFNNYGCAEAMPRLTIRSAQESVTAANIGLPLPGVELRVGIEGTLEFRSQYGAKAFIENGQLVTVSDEMWIPTGDLGLQHNDGSWELQGRANEVFKRYGEKISFRQLLATTEKAWSGGTAIFREKDSSGEDGYVMVVCPAPSESDLRAILRSFRMHHPRTHWPLRIESVASFPTLANGKIDMFQIADTPNKAVIWRQRI